MDRRRLQVNPAKTQVVLFKNGRKTHQNITMEKDQTKMEQNGEIPWSLLRHKPGMDNLHAKSKKKGTGSILNPLAVNWKKQQGRQTKQSDHLV